MSYESSTEEHKICLEQIYDLGFNFWQKKKDWRLDLVTNKNA